MSCTCQQCQRKYKVDLMLPDDLWNKIRPEGKIPGAGLLCISCIGERLEKLDEYGYLITHESSHARNE